MLRARRDPEAIAEALDALLREHRDAAVPLTSLRKDRP
jgi:hypothetical protein